MALRLVTEDEAPSVDPVEEVREGVELLDRLMTNPLLPDVESAIEAARDILCWRLERASR